MSAYGSVYGRLRKSFHLTRSFRLQDGHQRDFFARLLRDARSGWRSDQGFWSAADETRLNDAVGALNVRSELMLRRSDPDV